MSPIPTDGSTTTTSNNDSTQPADGSDGNTGSDLITGLVIGLIGLLLLAAVVWMFLGRRYRVRRKQNTDSSNKSTSPQAGTPNNETNSNPRPIPPRRTPNSNNLVSITFTRQPNGNDDDDEIFALPTLSYWAAEKEKEKRESLTEADIAVEGRLPIEVQISLPGYEESYGHDDGGRSAGVETSRSSSPSESTPSDSGPRRSSSLDRIRQDRVTQ